MHSMQPLSLVAVTHGNVGSAAAVGSVNSIRQPRRAAKATGCKLAIAESKAEKLSAYVYQI